MWNDSTLDREIFEARLLKEPHLAELVAQAVTETIAIREALAPTQSRYIPPIVATLRREKNPAILVPGTVWVLCIAAAVAVVVVPARWLIKSEPKSSSVLLAQIWSDISRQLTVNQMLEASDPMIESEDNAEELFLQTDENLDQDLPEWLIAATGIVNTNSGAIP